MRRRKNYSGEEKVMFFFRERSHDERDERSVRDACYAFGG
jgi:hypothetical protein